MDVTNNSHQQTNNNSMLSTLIDIFVAPYQAFDTLKSKPSIVFPLLLLLMFNIAVLSWYFSVVNYEWLIDDMMSQFKDMPADQLSQMRENFDKLGATGMLITSNVSSVVSVLLFCSLAAGYLTLVAMVTGSHYRFKHWFSLNCWTGIPGLAALVVMAINIALRDNDNVDLYKLNSLAFSNLGLLPDGNSGLKGLFDFISIPLLWSIALTTLGYARWTDSNLAKACMVVVLPYAIVFSVWAIIVTN